MSEPAFRLLVVDDNSSIHDDFKKIFALTAAGSSGRLAAAEKALFAPPDEPAAPEQPHYRIDSAYQGQDGVAMAAQARAENAPYAIAFVDMRMPPGWDGVETIQRLWQVDPDVQVVICTAYSDYSWEEILAKLGSTDSLLILKKPFDIIEVLQMAHNLARKWSLTQQARLQIGEMERMVAARTAELRHSEERFATAFRAAPLPQAIVNFSTGKFLDVNDAFCGMIGYAKDQILGDSPGFLIRTGLLDAMRHPHPLSNCECELRHKNGQSRRVRLSTQPTTLADQPHLILMADDVTERLQLEHQLRHRHKMEAVGQLAAGVAHDFNNILTIIQGHLSLQLASGAFTPESRAALTETLDASERAAALTRQLLTFSRKQLFQPQPLDLNALIQQDAKMLRRLIGETVELTLDCAENLPAVQGDLPSIEQVLMNLVINSRDAMPGGGKLAISTRAADVSAEEAAQNPEARAGAFVRLRVADNGHGMDQATLSRIFEPFFTTKDVGRGTGLGLATVYGIIRQHEGWLTVSSAPGLGAEFSVYLPVAAASAAAASAAPGDQPAVPANTGLTVLVVEDEPAVRTIMRQLLRHCGCTVIEAGDAREGYAQWSAHRSQIDLLITDIVMPGGLTGHDLARQLTAENPALKVIFCSGYSADLFHQGSDLLPGRNFLPKPYDAAGVFAVIRTIAREKASETLSA
jgi:PAS domain S-box-containing protein